MTTTDPEIEVQAHQRPSRFVFGSCNSQHYPQPMWPRIRSRNATAFIWGGDAIYADKTQAKYFNDSNLREALISKNAGTPRILTQLYLDLLAHPEYSQLTNETHILGSIDDHDYGTDNGDATFKYSREAAIEYVETFLRQDPGSAMAKRAQTGAGVYAVKVFDFSRPVGRELLADEEAGIDPDVAVVPGFMPTYSNRSVAVFILDIRSHKTPYKNNPLRFHPDDEGDFLGETQWAWLNEGLFRSKASINVVVNGLQVHADKYMFPSLGETWARFPTAQQRLYDLLLDTQNQVQMPILVSGDVHHAALSRKDCTSVNGNNQQQIPTRSLLEMTTSGLTHSYGSAHICSEPTAVCKWWYTKLASRSIFKIGYSINPWKEIITVEEGTEGAKSGLQYSLELNFGELEFDWENRMVRARVLGLDEDRPLLSVQWEMAGANEGVASQNVSTGSSWKCVNYRGSVHPIHRGVSQLAWFYALSFFAFLPFFLIIVLGVGLYRLLSVGYLRSNKCKTARRRSSSTVGELQGIENEGSET